MILLLETATLNCSVALATEDGRCVAHRDEAGQSHQHAERLHMLIDEVLQTTGTNRSDLTAVAIGKGPGSFTGLRIGTSAAKGICTGLNIPLLAPSCSDAHSVCQVSASRGLLQARSGLTHI